MQTTTCNELSAVNVCSAIGAIKASGLQPVVNRPQHYQRTSDKASGAVDSSLPLEHVHKETVEVTEMDVFQCTSNLARYLSCVQRWVCPLECTEDTRCSGRSSQGFCWGKPSSRRKEKQTFYEVWQQGRAKHNVLL